MTNFLIFLLLIALVVAVVVLTICGCYGHFDERLDRVSRRLSVVEEREEQLRGFVVLNAVPRKMVTITSMRDASELLERRLNPETLEWEPFVPHFGVDRSKLAPAGKGATGATP